MLEFEDARDPAVVKCAACGRSPGPSRPHEEPSKREPELSEGFRAIDSDAYYERRNAWERDNRAKKAGAA